MLHLLFLIPIIPFVSALLLAVVRFPRKVAAAIACVAIAASMVITFIVGACFLSSPPAGHAFNQVLWTWIGVGNFHPAIAFYLDPISLIFILVITFVGLLIHIYSTEYMAGDDGYNRFFCYMNLFVASMLTLVLGSNLLLLYLGWEGVGLCSYLLIAFWYRNPANGAAGRKAFYVTRVGDTALIIGLFLLFHDLGTLNIQDLMQRASTHWAIGAGGAIAAGFLLLGGAVGKSAQLPLQTWLPDAMAGPTPVSALIHAATMVTAGVYLIARTHVLYQLAPQAQMAVAIVGIATLLLAGFSALTQPDLKRALAYSTISQIGYMFLALGVGAWPAAIFHFMTHAFFKALLFLSAGMVIHALHEEYNMFNMGGLWKKLPVAFWTFLIAGCSLAALPFITAGSFSKDWIIWGSMSAANGSTGLWVAALFGALLTALYTFRMIFLVFFGKVNTEVKHRPGWTMMIPCILLAILSIGAGYMRGHFAAFVETVLPWQSNGHATLTTEMGTEVAAGLIFLLGLIIAWFLFLKRRDVTAAMTSSAPARALHAYWLSDWGMDWLYTKLLVVPVIWFARVNKGDIVDSVFVGIGKLNELAWRGLTLTENGRLRWYAAGVAAGSVIFIAVVLFA